jgi:hypothetical protein
MTLALECFRKAAYCEQTARAIKDLNNRATLLVLAQTWRDLGEAAKAEEVKINHTFTPPR